jgi:hypothetical protein
MNQYKTITLGAGETRSLSVKGKVFAVDTATGSFTARFDSGAPFEGAAKRVFGSSTSDYFRRITITDTSGGGNTIVYAVSTSDIRIESAVTTVITGISVKAASTYTKMSGAPAGATTTFSGTDSGRQRKQIIVQNREASGGNVIEVSDNTNEDDYRLRLAPGQMWTAETNGIVKVTVPGATLEAGVFETFYSS